MSKKKNSVKSKGAPTLFSYMYKLIDRLNAAGKARTAETYYAAMSSFRRFRQSRDIPLSEITGELIEEYQMYLEKKGLIPNSISFYMRILRAVYNRAVDQDLVDQAFPFKHVYTGVAKTVKRALPLKQIKEIRDLDLSGQPSLEFARDMFMLCFYLRGISFVDLSYLKKENFRNGEITYRRKKTGQLLRIACEQEILQLLMRYATPAANPYLVSIVTDTNRDPRNQYISRMYVINKNLKKVAEKAGLSFPLTLYVARHSWASAAHNSKIPISVISECMGHDSESTTQIYLASLDTSHLVEANRTVLSALANA